MSARNVHVCSKETEIALIHQKQISDSKKIDEIYKSIVGNGNPGIKDKIAQMEGALKFSQIVFGVIAVVVSVIAVFV